MDWAGAPASGDGISGLVATTAGAAGLSRSPDGLDLELGRRLRSRREAGGLTLADVGHAVGVSAAQILKYERGINRVSFSMLIRICRILGCRLSALVIEIEVSALGQAGRGRARPTEAPPDPAAPSSPCPT